MEENKNLGTEAIIEKILSDAQKKADEIKQNATNIASSKCNEATEWANLYNQAEEIKLKNEVNAVIEKKKTVAELDVRKLKLSTKQAIIDSIFNDALKKLQNLGKKDYLMLVEKLLNDNAEKGDEIILSKDKVINAKDIMDFEVVKKLNLTVKEIDGNFNGGIVLSNKVCDKDLTFKSIIENKKQENCSKIATKLF